MNALLLLVVLLNGSTWNKWRKSATGKVPRDGEEGRLKGPPRFNTASAIGLVLFVDFEKSPPLVAL